MRTQPSVAASVVSRMAIQTNRGILQFERYSDGDVIASLDGKHWLEIGRTDQSHLVAFFGPATSIGRKTPNDSTSSLKKDVRNEGQRWGVNVTTGSRYYYSSRDAARAGDRKHKVGESGRVA